MLQKYFFYVTDVTVTASRGHAEDTAVKSTKSMSASQDMTLEVKEKRSVEFILVMGRTMLEVRCSFVRGKK